ncbi:MAG: ABC transporter ATP-binding protein [Gemmatimonadaceae bacterium]|nr:ABC transporter ATP-binding protein [Gemmatimonadaceae bacterium]
MSGMMSGARSTAPIVRLTGIAKRFGDCHAVRDASLEVAAGEIHALVGENGAGKSTLMRILAGISPPDAGTIEVGGRDVTGWTTAQAIDASVGMVHQHFMLVPTLTIAENVILGREPMRGLAIDFARAEREVTAAAEKSGFRMNVRQLVRELSVGEQQRVEILKTLVRGARILILDEPTAVLSPPEVEELWRVLRALRDEGGTIILITHKLDEVAEISDTITVVREGRTVARFPTAGTSPASIARAMVGRDVVLAGDATIARRDERVVALAPALDVRHLVVSGEQRQRAVNDVSFTIQPREILGIAGVEGNGQSALIEAIAGLRSVESGEIFLDAADVTSMPVSDREERGLAHIPEDRHRRGLVLDYSIADNLILGRQRSYQRRGGMLDRTRILADARAAIAVADIRPSDPMMPARALSGGNQQKVVIARALARETRVLLAAQPTRGVDVGAIELIHARLRAARDSGAAILLVSAELSEILALSDRVAVMYGGRIVAIVPRSVASEEMLGPLMTGASA